MNKPPTAPESDPRNRTRRIAALCGFAGLALGACSSPLYDQPEKTLRRAVRESAERELVEARQHPEPVIIARESRLEALHIKPEVMQELAQMAGPDSYAGVPLELGANLYGGEQRVSNVTMQEAVASVVTNNLNVQFARLSPAISQAQLVTADAAFDWVFFSNFQWTATDQPRTSPAIGGSTVGVGSDQRQVVDSTTGLRRQLISGGQFTVQHEFIYTDVETDNLFTEPDPAREANLVLQLDQPLLRGFGSDVALSEVRLAENTERDEIQNLKATLIQSVTDTETAYWNLVRARDDLRILTRLLERGEQVLKVLRAREVFDIKPSQISDAAATVESRRGDVLRAQNILRQASDRLKTLINDPKLPIGAEALLLPGDAPLDQAVEFSLIDAANTALANRPEVQRAIISMDNTAIRQVVADNARLPLLNLRALTRFNGLGDSTDDPYRHISEGQFLDYQIGVNFEQPLGNRAADASFRVRRTERMQAVIAYRNTVQNVVGEVKNALRDLTVNYALIEQRRASRIAAAENVRTLLVEEQTIQGLTAEFLDLKLRRQEALAVQEQAEAAALSDYNAALARLYAAMGTALERNRIQFSVDNVVPEPKASDLFPDRPTVPLPEPDR